MSEREAQDLYERIRMESPVRVRKHTLGNGEIILILNGDYFVWSKEDYERYHAPVAPML